MKRTYMKPESTTVECAQCVLLGTSDVTVDTETKVGAAESLSREDEQVQDNNLWDQSW